MVLDLIQKFIPWCVGGIVLILIVLIIKNKNRLYDIRNSGRVSEIIDRRRNIVLYTILIVFLVIGLIIYLANS